MQFSCAKCRRGSSYLKMDKYQTYDYVETDNKMAIILTSNETGALTNTEILDSLVEFLN